MRVVLIGANGQLGTDLVPALKNETLIPVARADLDITMPADVLLDTLSRYSPDVIINTAAYHRVDEMEDYPDKAFLVNGTAVGRLAKAADQLKALFVHISTDYVFDGKKKAPYIEEDPPAPQSIYSVSKLVGEYMAASYASRHLVIRSCGLYGAAGCRASGGTNFVETMLRLAREKGSVRVVSDQMVTPTPTRVLAELISKLIHTTETGLFHATCRGECSWYDFAAAIFRLTGTRVTLEKTTSAEFASKAKRPSYSVLENRRLKKLGMDHLPAWESALESYLREKHPDLMAAARP